jgi:cytochrome c-type biogenesis protein CcmH/NrfG
LLLDRKRIKKWTKWIAIFLAVVFGASFLFLGVGYGGSGLNISEAFSCAGDQTTNTSLSVDEKIAAFELRVQQNPNDVEALLGLATIYQENGQLTLAIPYLEKVIVADPNQKDVYMRLANLYMNKDVLDYQGATTVLIKLTSLDPENPDVYLKLGISQRELGQTEAAILAWQKYLQLAPDGDMADVVKEQIATLSKKPTTTTTAGTGATTTTTGTGATGTTASSSPPATSPSTTTSTTR